MKQLCRIFFLIYLMVNGVEAAEIEPLTPPDLTAVKVLDLQTAQKIALAGNPDITAAMSRIEQARERIKQAAAAWWPSLDVKFSGAKTELAKNFYANNQSFSFLADRSMDRTSDDFQAGLRATWVLFDGFFRSYKQQQAEFNEKEFTAARRDSQRLLAFSVAEAFFNAQLSQTKVDIAMADEKFYLSQLRDANNRYEVGTGAWGDVLNIKVQLNSAKTSLMLNRRQFEAAGYGLAALMGISDAAFPEGLRLAELDRDVKLPSPQKNPETLIKEALAIRPDIHRLEILAHEAEAGSGQAKAPFYPKVQVVGTVDGDSLDDTSFSADDFGNTIGVNIAWNLFSGGADRARFFEARHKEREVAYNLASLRNQVAAEVRQDLALLAAAEEQVRLQRESVVLVKENRDLAENEYEAGEASLVRLNEAQRDLTTTYSRLAQALVGYHQARHRLLAATGKNVQPIIRNINTVK
jgi:outer membrane protein TolC